MESISEAVVTASALMRAADRARGLVRLLERNVFLVLVLALATVLLSLRVRGGLGQDSWLTFLGGREILDHGLPRHDALAVWTRGREWVDQQWLAQLGFRGLFVLGGLRLALLANELLLIGALAIALAAARLRGASERSVAIVGAVCFFVLLPNTALRAQTAAYVLFAVLLVLLLHEGRRRDNWIFLALPLIAVWANVHGSVVVGALLVALAGATFGVEQLRAPERMRYWQARAATLVFAPALCLFASPYGASLAGYYHRVLLNPDFAQMVTEWRATSFPDQWPFFALALPALWVVAAGRSRLSLLEKLAFLAMLMLAFTAIRNIAWFALAATAIVPAALDGFWAVGDARRRFRLNVALTGTAIAAAAVFAAAAAAHPARWYENRYPPAAAAVVADVAAREPGLKIFASERYADWLLTLHPALRGRIAYDARFELLSATQLQAIIRFRNQVGADWRRAARGYRLLVLDPDLEHDVVGTIASEHSARRLYTDENVVVLLRRRSR